MQLRHGLFSLSILQLLTCVLGLALPGSLALSHDQSSLIYDVGLVNVENRTSELSTTLTKRVFTITNGNICNVVLLLGAGWICQYNSLDWTFSNAISPPNDLVQFYSAVLSLAGNVWADEPPELVRRAVLGEISLTFTSLAPISFEFIQWFLMHAVCLIHPFIPPQSSCVQN